ncbi:Chitooligosaccharide deacetylase [bioreactor metagenome]|uniref:Chitooligosaccharide deacetylase n=1 Tax=bioreactor metagenome TaxID=1076179 RepID=A0A644T3D9_9ZZZZ|nr:ChbG/HpnK family deacetylase [Negativicutes bacterium]
MKKLIINADDFGLHEAVNSAVITAYKNGCLTSTSIMPSGKAFDNAVRLALQNPGLGIGIHLTLVAEMPVSDPIYIQSLVDSTGRFAPQYPQFLFRYLIGKISLKDIEKELNAQVQKVVASGINVTHIDSHQHLHIIPGILDIVVDIAKKYNIRAMRIPDEPYFFLGGYPFSLFRILGRTGLTFLAKRARNKIRKTGLLVPSNFFGMLAGGNMQQQYLANIINNLPNGVSEVMMHPADDAKALQEIYQWHYNWDGELLALTSDKIMKLLNNIEIQLVTFGELTHG